MGTEIEYRRTFLKRSFFILCGLGITGFVSSVFKFLFHDKTTIHKKPSFSGIFDPENDSLEAKSGMLNPIINPDGSIEISSNAIPEGASMIMAVRNRPIIVVHSKKGFKTFNATCTHLGCMVKWDESANRFICPCHQGQYDENGKVIAGPPPAPLIEHDMSVEGNKVIIMLA